MKKILVIAAHPDDEALGCGGSLLKSKSLGHEIHLLFMTDGISARNNITPNQFERRQKGIEDAIFPIKMEIDYVRVYQRR